MAINYPYPLIIMIYLLKINNIYGVCYQIGLFLRYFITGLMKYLVSLGNILINYRVDFIMVSTLNIHIH